MSKTQNNVVVVILGSVPSTEVEVLNCACRRMIRTVKWNKTMCLPDSLPRLTILLISESDQIIHFEDTVTKVRETYADRPVLALVGRRARPVLERIIETDIDDILLWPAEEDCVEKACDDLFRLRSQESCPSDLLTQVGMMNLIGRSRSFMEAVAQIPHLGRSSAPLLIQGATGTGKELFSRAIHYLGTRTGGPFVAVNCGGLPDHLLENELFGHVKGAFTDARTDHRGMVYEAAGGTLLLDEIHSLSSLAQVKLLRFIENRTYKRLGSAREEEADVRLIFASNIDLLELVEAGKFREDLYYRINVLTLELPPLNDREQDIPLLARAFLADFCKEYSCERRFLARDALEKMLSHSWPGNVRELRNVIERAATMAPFHIIRGADVILPNEDRRSSSELLGAFQQAKKKAVAQFERNYLVRLLAINEGNIAKSARQACQDRRTFQRLLSKYGLRGAGQSPPQQTYSNCS